jgi:hypothetical protein
MSDAFMSNRKKTQKIKNKILQKKDAISWLPGIFPRCGTRL